MGISIVIPIQSHIECNILMYKIFHINEKYFVQWLIINHYDTKTLVLLWLFLVKLSITIIDGHH